MKIEVNMEALLCLLKNEAEITRSRRENGLPMPAEIIERGDVSEIYQSGWKSGYWQGAECVISKLRELTEE